MNAHVKDVRIDKLADREYYIYGVSTIEDRAIAGTLDGLKPVTRRALWAAHKSGVHSRSKHIKSAKVVGNVIGDYHPHGDIAAYDAIVTAANSVQPMIDGKGNWGTPLDAAAAYRYTNLRLSHYSDNVFFDPFYLNAIETVPNFDGSNVEPVNLPALLPNLLINGNFGIATGVRASVPSFTVASLLKVIKIGLSREITAKDCAKHLVLTSLNGAKVNVDDPDNAELIDLYKTGKGKARFSCAVVERKDGSLRFNELPPVGILGAIDKIATLPAVALVTDDSDLEDVYPLSYRVVLKKGTTGQAKELTISKIKAILSCVVHFDTKITDRKMGEEDAVEAKLRSATIPQILNEWIKYRLKLESAACKFHMEKLDGKIARIDLLRAVIANLDFVIKLLKSKLDDEQITAKLAVKLKVSKELASEVLDFRLRQLKSLEDGKLVKQRKELVTEKKTLNVRRTKPGEYVGTTLKSLEAMAEKNFMTRLTQVRERLKSAKAKKKVREQ